MKYLCMVIVDEKKLKALSASDSQALDDESLAYDETLRKNGHFLAAQALQSVNTATTVRLRNGKISLTDGPFVETKEQVGGFILKVAASSWLLAASGAAISLELPLTVVVIAIAVAAFAYLFQLVAALLGLPAVLTMLADGPLQTFFRPMNAALAFVVPVQCTRWQCGAEQEERGQDDRQHSSFFFH